MDDKIILEIFYTDKGRVNGHLTKDEWLNSNIEVKNYLLSRYDDSESIVETIYRIKNNIEVRPVCKVCGKKVAYIGTKGYRDTCSISCAKKYIKPINAISDKFVILNDLVNGGELNANKLQDLYLRTHGYYDYINSIYVDSKSKSEKIYRLYYNIEKIPVCKECGSQLTYINFKDGYGDFCNDICKEKYGYRFKCIDDNIVNETIFRPGSAPYPRMNEKYLKTYHLYDYVINHYPDSNDITEILYRIKNGIVQHPVCDICGDPAKFVNFSIGYTNTCDNIKCVHQINENNSRQLNMINDEYIIDNVSYINCKKHNLIVNGVYDYIKNRYDDSRTLIESLYRIKNHIDDIPVCPICGKPNKFISPAKGYSTYCSFECTTRANTIDYYKSLGYNISIDDDLHEVTIFDCCDIHRDVKIGYQSFLRRLKNNETVCPICNPHKYTSIEKKIADILDELNVKYYMHDRRHIYPYEIDLFLPDYNIGIECNGAYWHSIYKIEKNKHLNKLNICNASNIRLITFWEDTINNDIEKIKSYLMSVLGFNKTIYARKCQIMEISSSIARDFIDKYHLQGSINSSIRLGLVYNNELVEIMTFGLTRKPLGGKQQDGIYELYRLCTKSGYTVVGGASKLLNYFKTHFDWNTLITYCENDISNGNVYETIGFTFEKNCDVGYWYYDKYGKRHNRYSLRKSQVDDGSGRTADEILASLGYIKCYNSGNKKYIMHKEED